MPEGKLIEFIRKTIMELSPDAMKAKKMGLKSKGFGNWVDPKTGEHFTTKGGKLHKVETPPSKGDREEPEAGAQAKDDVGGPAHPDAPEKKPSKPKIAKPMDNPYDVDKPKDDDSAESDDVEIGNTSTFLNEYVDSMPNDNVKHEERVKVKKLLQRIYDEALNVND